MRVPSRPSSLLVWMSQGKKAVGVTTGFPRKLEQQW